MNTKICLGCHKRVAPWYRSTCDYCYNFNSYFGTNYDEFFKAGLARGRFTEKLVVTDNQTKIVNISYRKTDSKLFNIVTFAFGTILVLWLIGGGMLEKNDSKNTLYIDCTNPQFQNSQYCNGSFENSIQEQNANDNSFYQNVVR